VGFCVNVKWVHETDKTVSEKYYPLPNWLTEGERQRIWSKDFIPRIRSDQFRLTHARAKYYCPLDWDLCPFLLILGPFYFSILLIIFSISLIFIVEDFFLDICKRKEFLILGAFWQVSLFQTLTQGDHRFSPYSQTIASVLSPDTSGAPHVNCVTSAFTFFQFVRNCRKTRGSSAISFIHILCIPL